MPLPKAALTRPLVSMTGNCAGSFYPIFTVHREPWAFLFFLNGTLRCLHSRFPLLHWFFFDSLPPNTRVMLALLISQFFAPVDV